MNSDELETWLEKAPVDDLVSIKDSIPGQPIGSVEIVVDDQEFAESREISVNKSKLNIGKTQIQFASSSTANINYQTVLTQQFSAYDRDNKRYLDEAEARSSPFRANFAFADIDEDGRLFKEELVSYMGRLSMLQQARTVATARDQEKELFDLLDKNRDNRVSPIELRAGAVKVAEWDDDGNKKLAKSEIPSVWQLTFGRGNSAPV